jgi:SAM-dependent methyltransferase
MKTGGVFARVSLFSLACAAAPVVLAQEPQGVSPPKRSIRFADVASGLRDRLPPDALSAARFDDYVARLERETAARERDGEYEHLVYFLLQSSRFTSEAKIEPALSALELLGDLAPAERARQLEGGEPAGLAVPDPVKWRIAAFAEAISEAPRDVRLRYFKKLVERTQPAKLPLAEHLEREYARVMRFLYQKEFAARDLEDPQQREAFMAELYRKRGHSTDTQVEANFAVHSALSVLRAQGARGIDRVLIVGPGLDFAPRTDLDDESEPQSYQPFAVADSLLGLGLADPARLRIHCVDINERVVAYLRGLRPGTLQLRLVPGIPERGGRRFEPDYRAYFERLGASIGEHEVRLDPGSDRLGTKLVLVRPELIGMITADRLDVVTQRYVAPPAYDVVVVTNVLGYFDSAQQALALANIGAMLRPGGYLVHNEPQTALVASAEALGLALQDARTLRVATHPETPLFDRVLIHRKSDPETKPKTAAPSSEEGS